MRMTAEEYVNANTFCNEEVKALAKEIVIDYGFEEEFRFTILQALINYDILLKEHGALLAIRDAIDRNTEAMSNSSKEGEGIKSKITHYTYYD